MSKKPRSKKTRQHGVVQRIGQGKYKDHRIVVVREDRLEKLDTTKFEVAIWLMARQRLGKEDGANHDSTT